MERPYLIGTGYCESRIGHDASAEQFGAWWGNTMKYSSPRRVLVKSACGHSIPNAPGQWINLDGDLGHPHHLQSGIKDFFFCDCSITFCALALLAYADECDFVFKEQDCFAVGPWMDQMKKEIGDAGIIFGRAKCMPAVMSLFYLKHEFIPEFVRLFLGTGDERSKDNEVEQKFHQFGESNPGKFARYSFGVDRDRPIPFDSDIFYCQQTNPEEYQELKRRGFLG